MALITKGGKVLIKDGKLVTDPNCCCGSSSSSYSSSSSSSSSCFVVWQAYWDCVGQVWSGASWVSSSCVPPVDGAVGVWNYVGSGSGQCLYRYVQQWFDCPPGGHYQNGCVMPTPEELSAPPLPETPFGCDCGSSSSGGSSSNGGSSDGGSSSSPDNRTCYFRWTVTYDCGGSFSSPGWGTVACVESRCDDSFGQPLDVWQRTGGFGSQCTYEMITAGATCGAYNSGCSSPNNLEMPNPPAPPSSHSDCDCGTCWITWRVFYDCASQSFGSVGYVSSNCNSGINSGWTKVGDTGNGFCEYQMTEAAGKCDDYANACNGGSEPSPLPSPPSPPSSGSDCNCPPPSSDGGTGGAPMFMRMARPKKVELSKAEAAKVQATTPTERKQQAGKAGGCGCGRPRK